VEQQEHGSELRQNGERLARGERRRVRSAEKRGVAQRDAHEQLTEHGGLIQPLEQLSGELRAHDHEGQQ
jgi:hypothetical protein